MWDIMNEPMVTSWVGEDVPDRDSRISIIWNFVHHFCGVMKELDSAHPITVGVAYAQNLAQVEAHVDVLSLPRLQEHARRHSRPHRRRNPHCGSQSEANLYIGIGLSGAGQPI